MLPKKIKEDYEKVFELISNYPKENTEMYLEMQDILKLLSEAKIGLCVMDGPEDATAIDQTLIKILRKIEHMKELEKNNGNK